MLLLQDRQITSTASFTVGAELGEGSIGEGHPQDRRASGDTADLEL